MGGLPAPVPDRDLTGSGRKGYKGTQQGGFLMSHTELDPLVFTCPCCGTVLHLDRDSGAVLLEERPKKGPVKSFEEAARENASRQEQARAQLARAMEERKHRDEILEKKFREAVKKAEKDEAPPPLRPFDLD